MNDMRNRLQRIASMGPYEVAITELKLAPYIEVEPSAVSKGHPDPRDPCRTSMTIQHRLLLKIHRDETATLTRRVLH